MSAQTRSSGGFNIKETLTAIVISFTMAFVFRGFVIEGFLIPTGSMAPTLMGKHMLVRNPDSGAEWEVGPWDYMRGNPTLPPAPMQGGEAGPIRLNDPMTGAPIERASEKLRAGDRLFVLKYLRGVYEPSRWDVVVFKAPHVEPQNFIKRLLGLPGEQIALVDGDVFYTEPDAHTAGTGIASWKEGVWKAARKPEHVQREVWQTVFDSIYTPDPATQQSLAPRDRFRSPWEGSGAGWTGVQESASYRYEGSGSTVLSWDTDARPIDDYTAYNQLRRGAQRWDRGPGRSIFPVSDVAMRFGIEPDAEGMSAEAELTARGFEFRGTVDGSGARVEMRRAPTADEPDPSWRLVDGVDREGLLPAGSITDIAFWHVDQAMWLFVGDELVCGGPEAGAYDLTPAQRVRAATGRTIDDLLERNPGLSSSALADTRIYRKPAPRWRLSGGSFTLHRVGLDRDLHYQVTPRATRGGHPGFYPTLSADHFMFCGDNSANSEDSRMWDQEYPWVTESIQGGEEHAGLVHRDLIIGRAFVVYLPSPYYRGLLPMFDFGKMRWIW